MGLQENFQKETVAKLDIRDAVTVQPTASLQEAMALMRSQNIGCTVVVDAERKPIGMFTESMLTEMLSHGPLNLDEPIDKLMSERCPWVRSSDRVADLLEAMQLKNVRMLAVVDEQDRVVGVTGQRGLMEYVADHFPGQVMVQRIGQTPYLSKREGA